MLAEKVATIIRDEKMQYPEDPSAIILATHLPN